MKKKIVLCLYKYDSEAKFAITKLHLETSLLVLSV